MRKRSPEKGAALIMLLGITAALAIMAVMLVTVLANQQAATAQQRDRVVSENYAEGAADAVVQAVKAASPLPTAPPAAGGGWLSVAELSTITSGLGYPPGTQIQYWIYDNQATVNRATNWDKGSPTASSTPDGMVWVEILATTSQGQKSRVRVLVRSGLASIVSGLPRAVVYADTGITLLGTSNLYAVENDGTAITTGGSRTWVMTGTYFTANGIATLKGPGSSVQAVGIRSNGAITPTGGFSDALSAADTVGLLSDYFDQSEQALLGEEAQSGTPTKANASGTSVSPTKFSRANITSIPGAAYNSTTKTYTFTNDLVVSGALTLKSGTGSGTGEFPADTTFKFKSLYVNGDLSVGTGDPSVGPNHDGWTVNPASAADTRFGWTPKPGTGQVAINTTALYVGGYFSLGGATSALVNHTGPVYVTGDANWCGPASVRTTDWTKANADATPPDNTDTSVNKPGALWVSRLRITSNTGAVYVLGDTWVNGHADGYNSTLLAGPSTGTAVQIWCPLLATTELTSSRGLVNCGSRTNPMTYYMQCDNDAPSVALPTYGYKNTCDWASQGTFYGLMVLMEARAEFTGSSSVPSVEGAVFVGTPATAASGYINVHGDIPSGDDITLAGASTIAYNQAVIDACINKSITTTTNTVQMVPGSWQQLSGN